MTNAELIAEARKLTACFSTWDKPLKDIISRLADALEAATPATEALRARIAELEAALRRISAGEGYYGAQAAEYKAIARAALDGNP